MKTRKKPRKRVNLTALATKLKVARSTIHAWKAAGAPVDDGEAAVLAWAMAESRKNGDDDELRAAKIAVLRQHERRLDLANAEREGKSIAFAKVTEFHTHVFAFLFNELDRKFGGELPPALRGLDQGKVKGRCLLEVARLKKRLSGLLDRFEKRR